MKRATWLAIALAALWMVPHVADSCGPFLPDFWFTSYHGPLDSEFDNGRFGVVRPHYYRRDLLRIYRTWSGIPRGAGEWKRPTGGPVQIGPNEAVMPPRIPPSLMGTLHDRADIWLAARKQIPGVPDVASVNGDRKVPGADYQFYANCLDDAFDSAATTLRKRVAQWGPASPKMKEWVVAQDQVFSNCEAGAAIPQPVSSPDHLVVADRRYQIAAAEFYAEQYGKAEADFDAIAKDQGSPWHEMAPYLAARACIRSATVAGDGDGLSRASKRLEALIDDPARKNLHEPAKALLGFVKARLDPQSRLVELGDELMKPDAGAHLDQVLTDYTWIWDHAAPEVVQGAASKSEVADWVLSFQQGSGAVEKWKSGRGLPWLASALAWEDAKTPAPPDLIAAAHAVKPDSPAYATVTYYGILQQIRIGERDAARQWADEALGRPLPQSAANLLRAERLNLARDWNEFLRYSTRTPVLYTDNDYNPPTEKRLAFDKDAAQPFNTIVPLSLWIDAGQSSLIPGRLQADVAQGAWVRAVILQRQADARSMAERLSRLKPELAPEMRKYLSESDPAAANFAAVFLILRGPGLEPLVRAGIGRETAVLKRDALRDNWWAVTGVAAPQDYEKPHQALYDLYPDGRFTPPDFLTKEQRSEGEAEWSRIQQQAGNSVNYLCGETLSWAKTHANDVRVPQALYLCVEATHFGPKDGEQGSRYSHEAFDVLHRTYPRSEWTARTKYWY
jgi:hypothetical protein